MKKKDSITYLKDNNLHISSGLLFTLNDYIYITTETDSKGVLFESIIINHNKEGRKEELVLHDILRRLDDLQFLLRLNVTKTDQHATLINEVLSVLNSEKFETKHDDQYKF